MNSSRLRNSKYGRYLKNGTILNWAEAIADKKDRDTLTLDKMRLQNESSEPVFVTIYSAENTQIRNIMIKYVPVLM